MIGCMNIVICSTSTLWGM